MARYFFLALNKNLIKSYKDLYNESVDLTLKYSAL